MSPRNLNCIPLFLHPYHRCENRQVSEQAEEIGRQAKIFESASRVFIWLTTFDLDAINCWASKMDSLFRLMVGLKFYTETDLPLWASRMRELVKIVLTDPWFSSPWTLQEAYLSPNAYILSCDARKGLFNSWCLYYLTETFSAIADALDNNDVIRRIGKESGLLELFNKHLMDLLTVAGNRTTTREEDRVYAIMQVSNLRLGASAPDADPRHNFTLSELFDQLGMALLQKYHIQSQILYG